MEALGEVGEGWEASAAPGGRQPSCPDLPAPFLEARLSSVWHACAGPVAVTERHLNCHLAPLCPGGASSRPARTPSAHRRRWVRAACAVPSSCACGPRAWQPPGRQPRRAPDALGLLWAPCGPPPGPGARPEGVGGRPPPCSPASPLALPRMPGNWGAGTQEMPPSPEDSSSCRRAGEGRRKVVPPPRQTRGEPQPSLQTEALSARPPL